MREEDVNMKTLEIGAVRGRHEMPVDTFVFDNAIVNFDIKDIEYHVDKFLLDLVFDQHQGEVTIKLYVTGLTVVTTAVVAWCFNHQIPLSLMHYDNVAQDYVEQVMC